MIEKYRIQNKDFEMMLSYCVEDTVCEKGQWNVAGL